MCAKNLSGKGRGGRGTAGRGGKNVDDDSGPESKNVFFKIFNI